MRPVLPVLAAVVVTAGPAPVSAQAVPGDFVITLERTRCFGTCPAYTVSVDAGGNVTYEGAQFVRVTGLQTDRVQASAVAALVASIERIGFFDLADRYRVIVNPDGTTTVVSDLPTAFVTVTMGGRSKRVEDYLGAPRGLRDLEQQIDDVARTARWVRIDAPELTRLVREGGPPSAGQLADWLRDALVYDEVDTVRALLAAGADPNGTFASGAPPLMMAESPGAVRALIEAGADPSVGSEGDVGDTPLMHAARLAPDATRILLEAGARADSPADVDGRNALWRASCGGNLGAVALLLEAGALASGADPRLRPAGQSALDCARRNRESGSLGSSLLRDEDPPWVADFDGVIALLEGAIAAR